MPAWIEIQRKAIRYAFDELSACGLLEGEVLEPRTTPSGG